MCVVVCVRWGGVVGEGWLGKVCYVMEILMEAGLANWINRALFDRYHFYTISVISDQRPQKENDKPQKRR